MLKYHLITIEQLKNIDEEVFQLLDGLKHRRFCKAEVIEDSIVCGQIVAPDKESEENITFGFCTSNDGLYLINVPEKISCRISKLKTTGTEDQFGIQTLYRILSYIIKDDFYYLTSKEEELKDLEDVIFAESDKNDDVKIFEARKSITRFTRYYDQLLETLEDIQEYCDYVKMEDESDLIGRLYRKVERLEALSSLVQDYAKQLFDLHASRVANKQNDIMSLLTIVTSIIAPLTLITGWYGMNFVNMPELYSSHGYRIVILLCLIIVVAEIIFIKRHKWFR